MAQLITLEQTARQVGISVAAVRSWRYKRKHLEFVKLGRSVRVSQSSIDRFIEQGTLGPDAKSDGTSL